MSSAPEKVTSIAVFPPPVNGMSLCTQKVVDTLTEKVSVRRYNLSSGDVKKKRVKTFRFKKLLRVIMTLPRFLFARRPAGAVLYMPADSKMGLYYTMLFCLCAKLRGYRVVLHHQVYSYVNRQDWRMKCADRLMGEGGLHLVLCEHMRHVLMKKYQFRASQMVMPNSIMLLGEEGEPSGGRDELGHHGEVWRLGHLSNLWKSKGLPEVIETFMALRDQGYNVELILAGPVREQDSQRMIDECLEKYAGYVDYRGPVYDEAKDKFFRDIDVLVFPSQYFNEAQPVVINEAFEYGKPLLAYSISCIPALVGENKNWVTPLTSDFVAYASGEIINWINDEQLYKQASESAFARSQELRQEAAESLDRLGDWVIGDE